MMQGWPDDGAAAPSSTPGLGDWAALYQEYLDSELEIASVLGEPLPPLSIHAEGQDVSQGNVDHPSPQFGLHQGSQPREQAPNHSAEGLLDQQFGAASVAGDDSEDDAAFARLLEGHGQAFAEDEDAFVHMLSAEAQPIHMSAAPASSPRRESFAELLEGQAAAVQSGEAVEEAFVRLLVSDVVGDAGCNDVLRPRSLLFPPYADSFAAATQRQLDHNTSPFAPEHPPMSGTSALSPFPALQRPDSFLFQHASSPSSAPAAVRSNGAGSLSPPPFASQQPPPFPGLHSTATTTSHTSTTTSYATRSHHTLGIAASLLEAATNVSPPRSRSVSPQRSYMSAQGSAASASRATSPNRTYAALHHQRHHSPTEHRAASPTDTMFDALHRGASPHRITSRYLAPPPWSAPKPGLPVTAAAPPWRAASPTAVTQRSGGAGTPPRLRLVANRPTSPSRWVPHGSPARHAAAPHSQHGQKDGGSYAKGITAGRSRPSSSASAMASVRSRSGSLARGGGGASSGANSPASSSTTSILSSSTAAAAADRPHRPATTSSRPTAAAVPRPVSPGPGLRPAASRTAGRDGRDTGSSVRRSPSPPLMSTHRQPSAAAAAAAAAGRTSPTPVRAGQQGLLPSPSSVMRSPSATVSRTPHREGASPHRVDEPYRTLGPDGGWDAHSAARVGELFMSPERYREFAAAIGTPAAAAAVEHLDSLARFQDDISSRLPSHFKSQLPTTSATKAALAAAAAAPILAPPLASQPSPRSAGISPARAAATTTTAGRDASTGRPTSGRQASPGTSRRPLTSHQPLLSRQRSPTAVAAAARRRSPSHSAGGGVPPGTERRSLARLPPPQQQRQQQYSSASPVGPAGRPDLSWVTEELLREEEEAAEALGRALGLPSRYDMLAARQSADSFDGCMPLVPVPLSESGQPFQHGGAAAATPSDTFAAAAAAVDDQSFSFRTWGAAVAAAADAGLARSSSTRGNGDGEASRPDAPSSSSEAVEATVDPPTAAAPDIVGRASVFGGWDAVLAAGDETKALELLSGYASGFISGRCAAKPELGAEVRGEVLRERMMQVLRTAMAARKAGGGGDGAVGGGTLGAAAPRSGAPAPVVPRQESQGQTPVPLQGPTPVLPPSPAPSSSASSSAICAAAAAAPLAPLATPQALKAAGEPVIARDDFVQGTSPLFRVSPDGGVVASRNGDLLSTPAVLVGAAAELSKASAHPIRPAGADDDDRLVLAGPAPPSVSSTLAVGSVTVADTAAGVVSGSGHTSSTTDVSTSGSSTLSSAGAGSAAANAHAAIAAVTPGGVTPAASSQTTGGGAAVATSPTVHDVRHTAVGHVPATPLPVASRPPANAAAHLPAAAAPSADLASPGAAAPTHEVAFVEASRAGGAGDGPASPGAASIAVQPQAGQPAELQDVSRGAAQQAVAAVAVGSQGTVDMVAWLRAVKPPADDGIMQKKTSGGSAAGQPLVLEGQSHLLNGHASPVESADRAVPTERALGMATAREAGHVGGDGQAGLQWSDVTPAADLRDADRHRAPASSPTPAAAVVGAATFVTAGDAPALQRSDSGRSGGGSAAAAAAPAAAHATIKPTHDAAASRAAPPAAARGSFAEGVAATLAGPGAWTPPVLLAPDDVKGHGLASRASSSTARHGQAAPVEGGGAAAAVRAASAPLKLQTEGDLLQHVLLASANAMRGQPHATVEATTSSSSPNGSAPASPIRLLLSETIVRLPEKAPSPRTQPLTSTGSSPLGHQASINTPAGSSQTPDSKVAQPLMSHAVATSVPPSRSNLGVAAPAPPPQHDALQPADGNMQHDGHDESPDTRTPPALASSSGKLDEPAAAVAAAAAAAVVPAAAIAVDAVAAAATADAAATAPAVSSDGPADALSPPPPSPLATPDSPVWGSFSAAPAWAAVLSSSGGGMRDSFGSEASVRSEDSAVSTSRSSSASRSGRDMKAIDPVLAEIRNFKKAIGLTGRLPDTAELARVDTLLGQLDAFCSDFEGRRGPPNSLTMSMRSLYSNMRRWHDGLVTAVEAADRTAEGMRAAARESSGGSGGGSGAAEVTINAASPPAAAVAPAERVGPHGGRTDAEADITLGGAWLQKQPTFGEAADAGGGGDRSNPSAEATTVHQSPGKSAAESAIRALPHGSSHPSVTGSGSAVKGDAAAMSSAFAFDAVHAPPPVAAPAAESGTGSRHGSFGTSAAAGRSSPPFAVQGSQTLPSVLSSEAALAILQNKPHPVPPQSHLSPRHHQPSQHQHPHKQHPQQTQVYANGGSNSQQQQQLQDQLRVLRKQQEQLEQQRRTQLQQQQPSVAPQAGAAPQAPSTPTASPVAGTSGTTAPLSLMDLAKQMNERTAHGSQHQQPQAVLSGRPSGSVGGVAHSNGSFGSVNSSKRSSGGATVAAGKGGEVVVGAGVEGGGAAQEEQQQQRKPSLSKKFAGLFVQKL